MLVQFLQFFKPVKNVKKKMGGKSSAFISQ